MLGSLFNKVRGLKVCNISATPTQMFPADIAKFLRIAFKNIFYATLPVGASDSPSTVQ